MRCDVDAIAIEARGLGKRYGFRHARQWRLLGGARADQDSADGFIALEGVDLTIGKGESVGILGRNGAGKSTLLQLLTGTLQPTFGAVRVDGRVSALLELGAGFNPEFTGRENVFLCAAALGMSRRETDAKYPEIAAFADIGDFVDRPVKTYSSGMLVRLAFALQVHVDPDILIVDEALSVGDIFFQQKCVNKIRDILGRGVTLLFVSHSLGSVKSLCRRAIHLEGGRVVADGDAAEVCDRFQNSLSSAAPADLFSALERTHVEGGDASVIEVGASDPSRSVFDAAFASRLTQRSGNGDVVFSGFEIFDGRGRRVHAIEQCGPVHLRAEITARTAIPAGAAIGVLVRDANGIDLIAYNSNFSNTVLPALAAGASYLWELEVDLPLARGYYSFHCGIKPNPAGAFFYDRCFNAAVLEVRDNPPPWGDYGGRIIHRPRYMRFRQLLRGAG